MLRVIVKICVLVESTSQDSCMQVSAEIFYAQYKPHRNTHVLQERTAKNGQDSSHSPILR